MHISCNNFVTPPTLALHRETMAAEIWADTDGQVDILIAAVGTGGTITGVAEAIERRKPSFGAIAVEPTSSPVLVGGEPGSDKIQGIGAGFISAVYRAELVDEVIQVSDEEAIAYSRRLAKEKGLLFVLEEVLASAIAYLS